VRRRLEKDGLLQRVAAVNAAAGTQAFAARLNVLVKAYEDRAVTHSQVRDLALQILTEHGVPHEGVAITVQWFPDKMELVLRARPEHRLVEAAVAGAKLAVVTGNPKRKPKRRRPTSVASPAKLSE